MPMSALLNRYKIETKHEKKIKIQSIEIGCDLFEACQRRIRAITEFIGMKSVENGVLIWE